MFEHFENEKARKKSMTTAEKKEAKAAKDALEAPYTHCMLDGRKEKVGNFRVEPPGLFRGRGDHPKKGKLKVGVYRLRVGCLLTARVASCATRGYHDQYRRRRAYTKAQRSW